MAELTIESYKDRVLFIAEVGSRDVILTPDQAYTIADGIETAAKDAEAWVKAGKERELLTHEVTCQVKSWDGRINLRFSEIPKRIPIRYEDAFKFAETIRAKIPESKHRATIVFEKTASLPLLGRF